MKKRIALIIAVVLMLVTAVSGCGTSKGKAKSDTTTSATKSSAYTAAQIVDKLKSAGLPIGTVISYTADTDVNSMLGRPNQYISKTNFSDTTVEQTSSDPNEAVGGSVETFSNSDDLQTRKTYIEGVIKAMPVLNQYLYVNGNYLLRVDGAVTPDNAKKYETAFEAIK